MLKCLWRQVAWCYDEGASQIRHTDIWEVFPGPYFVIDIFPRATRALVKFDEIVIDESRHWNVSGKKSVSVHHPCMHLKTSERVFLDSDIRIIKSVKTSVLL